MRSAPAPAAGPAECAMRAAAIWKRTCALPSVTWRPMPSRPTKRALQRAKRSWRSCSAPRKTALCTRSRILTARTRSSASATAASAPATRCAPASCSTRRICPHPLTARMSIRKSALPAVSAPRCARRAPPSSGGSCVRRRGRSSIRSRCCRMRPNGARKCGTKITETTIRPPTAMTPAPPPARATARAYCRPCLYPHGC